MEITILCKVVDNFGDIGVAWRIAKRFVELAKKENLEIIEKINLIVDGLSSFNKIENSIDITQSFQTVKDVCGIAMMFATKFFHKMMAKNLLL